jgi:hypothetical protein
MIKYLCLFLLSTGLFAQEDLAFDYHAEGIEERAEETIVTETERALKNDGQLRDLDSDLGVDMSAYYTGRDSSLLSLSYLMSSNYEDPTEHVTIQGHYMKRTESYDDWWWGFQFQQTAAAYQAIADQMDSASVARTTTTQSFSMLGMGISRRFTMAKRLFKNPRWFEDIRAFANVVYHKDAATEEFYQGLGFTAEYVLQYRMGKNFYYGGKLSYNLAQVAFTKEDQSAVDDREFVFGWLGLGFELGLVFQ